MKLRIPEIQMITNRHRAFLFVVMFVFYVPESGRTLIAASGAKEVRPEVHRFEAWKSIQYESHEPGKEARGENLFVLSGSYQNREELSSPRSANINIEYLSLSFSASRIGKEFFNDLSVIVEEAPDGDWRVVQWIGQPERRPDNEVLEGIINGSRIIPLDDDNLRDLLRETNRSRSEGDPVSAEAKFIKMMLEAERIESTGKTTSELSIAGQFELEGVSVTNYSLKIELDEFKDLNNSLNGSNLAIRIDFNDADRTLKAIPSVRRTSVAGTYFVDGQPISGRMHASLAIWYDTENWK